ncbi:DUF2147 domain-containing protein [Acinetobacter sp. 187]|uniref:DUF2147 domain-containing protein n=1 Tax=Acinetobacter lanii TaxID=2715163 RepID=UPI001409C59E|nr:DUF2147 domain-containing protein [Acinetobacter lanii]NHC04856.1 DUF2147 domain-containing protein [Acinetobacter lanii]
MGFNKFGLTVILATLSSGVFAKDITGTWQQIDDKSGAPKALIQIRKEANNTYTGKIIKVTPLPGYTPRERCNDCPAPYSNTPILGMDVLKGLTQQANQKLYNKGSIIDPLAGKVYSAQAKLNESGNRLTLRAFMGVSSLGRSQTWIRQQN